MLDHTRLAGKIDEGTTFKDITEAC